MKYFNFSCPFCQQQFSIASELDGEFFKCPTCSKNFIMDSGKENFHPAGIASNSSVNRADAKNNMDSFIAATVAEQIKQLKTEIASQTKILKTMENRADTLNAMFTGFFVLWSLVAIVGTLTIVINFSDINDSLNKLQKIYKSPNHIEKNF